MCLLAYKITAYLDGTFIFEISHMTKTCIYFSLIPSLKSNKLAIYSETSNVNCNLGNVNLSECFQVHDIIINYTDSYNFRQFQKYFLLESCYYSGYDMFATYVKHLEDVCKYSV
jgi:hypothetical protein